VKGKDTKKAVDYPPAIREEIKDGVEKLRAMPGRHKSRLSEARTVPREDLLEIRFRTANETVLLTEEAFEPGRGCVLAPSSCSANARDKDEQKGTVFEDYQSLAECHLHRNRRPANRNREA